MGQYGLKIKNIEASTLYEYNIGVRDHYEYKDAMFVNSLFSDFLLENGMSTWKDESTRDIICLEFNYGTRSYQQEREHFNKMFQKTHKELRTARIKGDEYLIQKTLNKRNRLEDLFFKARRMSYEYDQLSKDDLRELYYNNGVSVEYVSRDKKGNIKKREVIHYRMLFRSTGKAKKGACMFIRDKLYKKARDFLYMGIKLPKKNAKIVEISAYAPLVSSGIVGKVKINPKNILILKDVDRFFETNVVSVETDERRQCVTKHISGYKLKNTLFDGQALIDSSIFPSWGNGYILLRHHFCKMAAFNTNIQQFFRDYFGENYQNATVEDMFGVKHYVKDIELITTDNAMKWLKFDVSYDCWCERVYENNCMFGIVKTAHPSKLGRHQKMSYQMVNSLDYDIMSTVCAESFAYVNQLKNDDAVFFKYLKDHSNFSNDYEVLLALCDHNPDFKYSSYFKDRKKRIIENYVIHMKSGEIIQNAENLTVVGSPYAMLLYAATGIESAVDNDDTFFCEHGSIQCYSERFEDGEYLAFFRSPFNSKNNILYLHNGHNPKIKKYFNLGKQCVAINMNGTDAQDRANGMDMDSDFGFTTNQPEIVLFASKCYKEYPTVVNNIPKESNVYNNTMNDFARMDSNLAKSQTDIGGSSNLAQIGQTYSCNSDDSKYDDYVCILSVLAQVAIDNAKRRFDVDVAKEISRIKADMDIEKNKYPEFWRVIKRDFNRENINKDLVCPMNYLVNANLGRGKYQKTIPMDKFFIKHPLDIRRRKCIKVEELIERFSIDLIAVQISGEWNREEVLVLKSNFNDLVKDLRQINISGNYLGLMSWLIDRAFFITPSLKNNKAQTASKLAQNKAILLKVLYECNPKSFLSCFTKNIDDQKTAKNA